MSLDSSSNMNFIKYLFIKVGYYLHESRNWALDVQELERSIKEAKTRQEGDFQPLSNICFHLQMQSQGHRHHQPGKSNWTGKVAQLQLKIILFSERFSRERILKQWSDLLKRRSSSYLLMRWKFVYIIQR